MWTVIILASIGFIVFFYREVKYWGSFTFSDLDMYFLQGAVGLFFGALLGFVIAILLPCDSYVKKETLYLESLQDGSGVKGRFFLGSGQFNSEMKYVFYYKSADGFRMAQIPSEDVAVKYSAKSPSVKVYSRELTNAYINYWAIDFDLTDLNYVIEIPEGSINNSFTLDAQ